MRGGKRFCRIEEFFDDSMLTSKLVFGTISERSENGATKKNLERLEKGKKLAGRSGERAAELPGNTSRIPLTKREGVW